MNTIKQDIGKYLSLRRSLGYKLRGYDSILGQFADFLQQRNASYITRNLALAWLQQCNGKSGIWNQRLVAVRGFALYRQGTDPRTEIPEPTSVPSKNLRAKPYLYSDIEIEQLLQALVSRTCPMPARELAPVDLLLPDRVAECDGDADFGSLQSEGPGCGPSGRNCDDTHCKTRSHPPSAIT